MKFKPAWGALFGILATGCGSGGPAAGGQSGTDADGGYSCSYPIVEAKGEAVSLDETVGNGRTANGDYAVVGGTFAFLCPDDELYEVSVRRGASARRALGLLNESTPDERCESLQLDAEVHSETESGAWSHDASFVTSDLLGTFWIGEPGLDSEGHRVELGLQQQWTPTGDGPINGLRVDRVGISTTYCALADGVDTGGAGGADAGGADAGGADAGGADAGGADAGGADAGGAGASGADAGGAGAGGAGAGAGGAETGGVSAAE